jgi:TfoX/Sxy family transcriptional regulator of competence genes
MATARATIDHLLDLLAPAEVSARAMFGEFALYINGRVVALVCDDTLFLKPTPGALALLAGCEMAAPYPGAKPHLLLSEQLDDPEQVIEALRIVAVETPAPKPRKKRTKG